MGFDSRLVPSSATATPHRAGSGSKTRSSGGGGGAAAGEATPGVARIRVEGMTCSSCVASIEDMIGNRNDVIEIKVSLEQELAVVRYQSLRVSPEQLAEAIEVRSQLRHHLRPLDSIGAPLAKRLVFPAQ